MTLMALSGRAVPANAPTVVKFGRGDAKMYVGSISNNGLWAISEIDGTTDGSISPAGGRLIDLTTMEERDISDSSGVSGVSDVSNDGKTVVGECMGRPAFWDGNTARWIYLPMPAGSTGGRLAAVTPDGRYAVGYCNTANDIFSAIPVLYDLVDRKLVETPGLPRKDMFHEDSQYHNFSAISADGRYILGQMSKTMPIQSCTYVYDREASTYNMIGFDENPTGKWTPHFQDLGFIDQPVMSPNGLWVTGSAYMIHDIPGSSFANEYNTTFRYNVLTKEFEVYDGDGESDYAGYMIDNDGVVYAVTPVAYPVSSVFVRKGKYYYSLTDVFRQAYGYDFVEQTGFEVTGKPCSVSDDGLTMAMLYLRDQAYLLRLKEPIYNVVDAVDLLGNYVFTPANGVTMSVISSVKLTFDRNVAIIGNPQNIELRDENGRKIRSAASVKVDKQIVEMGFRSTTIPEGKCYTIYIPAGTFSIAGDAQVTNKEIEVTYCGRGSAAVTAKSIYPADGASIAGLDLLTNPIVLNFDADLKLKSESATAKLYREGEDEPFCDLYASVGGKQLVLYPLAEQHLFKDTEYKVVIPAGMVTDLSGLGDNEMITIRYSGTYVRTISADDRFLFADECNNYDNFMFYEGDRNTPQATPAGWGFTAETTPWYLVCDYTGATDMAFGSHSMYTPAGRADDWMVTPQLFVPDEDCYLKFQSQSYLASKEDYLKVYVYTSDDVYNTLNSDIVDRIRTQGKLVYNELQSPGASQEDLTGDWRDNLVSLKEYAGKNIYIAFVNDNYDQSAVFVDNIQVIHDMKYLVSFVNEDRVVNRSDITIAGTITVQSEVNKYNNVSMTLKNSAGDVVDTFVLQDQELTKDDVVTFAFDNALPLNQGSVNNFSVEVALDDDRSVINSAVRNLIFEPGKMIVLEEFSGAECQNCPQGFQAVKNINTLYPDKVLPIVLRTYGGDTELAVGLEGYNSFLGLYQVGAPSARINRGNPSYPMINHNGRYLFTGAGIPNQLTGRDEECWLDLVRKELSSPADAEVGIQSAVDADGKTANLSIGVRSALDLNGQSLNLFAVVVEDGVETYQKNGFSTTDDANLGDWGKGGIWGNQEYVYPFILDHCARSTAGVTFNGTGGLIPADLKAGETYHATMAVRLPQSIGNLDKCHVIVMLIDAATGRVVNANTSPLNGASGGIGNVTDNISDTAIAIDCTGTVINVATTGKVTVGVYNVNGVMVAAGAGDGRASVDLTGHAGVYIVKAVTAAREKVQKVIVR